MLTVGPAPADALFGPSDPACAGGVRPARHARSAPWAGRRRRARGRGAGDRFDLGGGHRHLSRLTRAAVQGGRGTPGARRSSGPDRGPSGPSGKRSGQVPDAGRRGTSHTGAHDRTPCSSSSTYRRLTLSSTDRKIGGVCGGMAEYFNVDPTLIRVIAVVLAVLGGAGVVAYLMAWLIIPKA